jgi:hypothetical protein
LNGIFRDSGFVDAERAHELKALCSGHDGFKAFEMDEKEMLRLEPGWDDFTPVEKTTFVVAAVLPRMKDKLGTPQEIDPRDPNDVIDILREGASYIDFKNMFGNKEDQPEWKMGQVHGHSAVMLARMVPAARMFLEQVRKIIKFPFEGFALVDPKDNILKARMGLVIAHKKKSVDEILEYWQKSEDEEMKKKVGTYRVVPIRITIEKGVEIL